MPQTLLASLRFAVVPLAVLLVAMMSVQGGAAIAKSLFPQVGPIAVAQMRLAFGSLMMLVFFRPWRSTRSSAQWFSIFCYGASLSFMNLSFYAALNRIPLGIAVAVEFLGPLSVASWSARRLSDFLWIALAAAGILLLLPEANFHRGLDPIGLALALLAGACWAAYIVFGKRASAKSPGAAATLGSCVAALLACPLSAAFVDMTAWSPHVLLLGIAVAFFSSAIPNSLDMIAMSRLSARAFGTLMSLEPVIAAIMGFLFLSERLTALQALAIALIVIASFGTVSMRGDAVSREDMLRDAV